MKIRTEHACEHLGVIQADAHDRNFGQALKALEETDTCQEGKNCPDSTNRVSVKQSVWWRYF